jgi:uncharacterized membrane protein YcaP (DUF421 family)
MWFAGWHGLTRVLLIGVPAYVALLMLMRIGGKRTLSKFNAFDLVVTVAFGSTLSAGLLNKDIALAEIVLAFALLVGLQYTITRAVLWWPALEAVVKSEPRMVLRNGKFLHDAIRDERLTVREVEAAIRAHGMGSIQDTKAVILETDGSFSVIGAGAPSTTALHSVRGATE